MPGSLRGKRGEAGGAVRGHAWGTRSGLWSFTIRQLDKEEVGAAAVVRRPARGRHSGWSPLPEHGAALGRACSRHRAARGLPPVARSRGGTDRLLTPARRLALEPRR